MNNIKLCLAQVSSQSNNIKANVKRILQSMERAKNKKADYIIFPELFLTGISQNSNLSKQAISVPSPQIELVCKKAKSLNIGVVIGFPEKVHNDIYNSALVISKKGEIIHTYRKIHLTGLERTIFTPGSSCSVIDLPEVKIGLMISYDIEFPEIARILAVNGAQIILTLSAHKYPFHKSRNIYLTSRAMENHIFIANVNMIGLQDQIVYFGESSVIEPNGNILSYSTNNEELPVVEIDLSKIQEASSALDYMRNRRPKVYEKEKIY